MCVVRCESIDRKPQMQVDALGQCDRMVVRLISKKLEPLVRLAQLHL